MRSHPKIGFIGQGFVGKSYADALEARGLVPVRYALEEPYRANRDAIRECDIVFICVPTPTTPKGFDASIVESALRLVGDGAVAVIKSTVIPGTTRRLQKKYKKVTILFAPEFLNASTAAHDAAHPFSNVIGIPENDERHSNAVREVLGILPEAPFVHVCTSEEAEIYKYAHNVSGYAQVVIYNLCYDLARKHNAKWEAIREALNADPMVSRWYTNPVHKSGRGAGGACFIKDFAAFTDEYARRVGNKDALAMLRAAAKFNNHLLRTTRKDLDLLAGVYGPAAVRAAAPRKKSRRARTRKSR